MQQAVIDSIALEPFLVSLVDKVVTRLSTTARVETITFGELFALYYEKHVKIRLKDTANSFYFFKVHGPRWAAVPVHKITKGDLQDWIDTLAKKSPSAATRALDMMKAIINWGIRRDHLPAIANPCNGVERFKIPSRKRFAVPDELVRLNEALDREPPIMRAFFWVCLLTGARRSNVLSMEWKEIDLDLQTWTIPETKMKASEIQIIPLSPPAVCLLKQRKERAGDSQWVFPGRVQGDHLKEPKRAWKRVLDRAGIDDLRIHDLRRTMGSYLAMNGESQYVIAQMLGHKDMRSTAVYARLDLATVRRAAEAVGEKWQNLLAIDSQATLPALQVVKAKPLADRGSQAKNANVKITGADQVIVEGKILTVLRTGGNTKKSFYSKIGSLVRVNSSEMDRILQDMTARKLIELYQDDRGCKRYALLP